MSRIFSIARIAWLELLRRKELYALGIMMAGVLGALLSVKAYGLDGAAGHIKELGLLLAWALSWALAVNVTARQIPQEESSGTIFPLLAKPLTRAEFLLGKWLGCWTVVCAATTAFYLLAALVAALRGGKFNPSALAQGLILHFAALAVISALALFFSTRLHRDAAATLTFVATISARIFVPAIPNLCMYEFGWRRTGLLILYYALPHLELFDLRQRLVHGGAPAPGEAFILALLYGAALTAALLILAWLAYRNKRFSRGTML